MGAKPRTLLLMGTLLCVNAAVAGGDPEAGRTVFQQCQVCHSLQPGQHQIGPSLAGIVGRNAGAATGYEYSAAMKHAGLSWTTANLDQFLTSPQSLVPGTIMPFSLPDERERRDLIAYLQQAAAQAPQVENGAVHAVSIVREPTDVPPPLGKRGPQTIKLELKAEELEGRLADGASYKYWTFNGKVPGPLLRVRVGDSVELTLANDASSAVDHSVDLHAVTGPHGGAADLQVPPGQRKTVTFKLLTPGLFVYHCATPMVAQHMASGMYGMILVEPEEGLPPVDREFYVMQGEIYTEAAYGAKGRQTASVEKLLNERPDYFVFNGAVGALTKEHPLRARVGETVRIFFGVGGPNATSSFHVIGEILDRVYEWGGVINAPVEGVQTISVPPGGAAIVDLTLDVPGKYIIVDHALSRVQRGLVGILIAEGAPKPAIFRPGN